MLPAYMKLKPARRAVEIEYAIRDIILPARELERRGEDIIHLNIGDPCAYDFDVPEHIKRALFAAVIDGYNGYGDSEGDAQLRSAIAGRERRKNGNSVESEDILITAGITEGIQLLLGALIEEGDELLVPGPTYPPYSTVTKFYGGQPKAYRTVEEEGWRPDIEDLRNKISAKTKGILVVSPNNPTGAVYSSGDLKQICDLAGEHGLPVISDEIYDMLTYGVEHVSPSSISKDIPLIQLNGFSKSYLVTGWRMGYLIFRDSGEFLSDLKEAVMREARARLSCNTPAQRAMLAALEGPQEHVRSMVRELKKRRDYIVRRINSIPGLHTQIPGGAFYIFPSILSERWKDDMQFVLHALREAHVLFVNGSGFNREFGKMHFRSVFLAPVSVLESAMDRLERTMNST